MLFHRKTPMAEPYCNYWRKSSNFTTIGRLRRDCFPVSLHHSTSDSRFCTFVQFFPRHCVPYLSFWSLSLFCHKQEFSLLFMQVYLLGTTYENKKYDQKLFQYLSQPAITCSKLTIETLEQGVKHVQS